MGLKLPEPMTTSLGGAWAIAMAEMVTHRTKPTESLRMEASSKIGNTVSHFPKLERFICMDAALTVESARADFEEVFRTHYPRIARVIARMVQNPGRAEEL